MLNQMADLGDVQDVLALGGGETVTLQQLRGIELNERAAALAELVLWIGFLQWHIRTQGHAAVAEPVVHDYGNIECRDAVLHSASSDLAYDAQGRLLTRWDGSSFKPHPVTGALVPDEAAQVPQWNPVNPRQAVWPQADFIVGNPPFIGASTMRAALGDGYVQALRSSWPEVPESADFVMYWWSRAAALAGAVGRPVGVGGAIRGARAAVLAGAGAGNAGGLILSKAQKSAPGIPHPGASNKVGSSALGIPAGSAISLVFAIADHPWVDSANGAAVRIAMTVGALAGIDAIDNVAACEYSAGAIALNDLEILPDSDESSATAPGELVPVPTGRLLTVTQETTGEFGEVDVVLTERTGVIHADLSVGADVTSAVALKANGGITSRGVMLFGAGFIVTPEEAAALLPLQMTGATALLPQHESSAHVFRPLTSGEGGEEGVPRHPHIIRDYRNGCDLTDAPRGVKVIDLFGLTADQVRQQFPAVYQWLHDRVKPERDANRDTAIRENWWLHGRTRGDVRLALAGLPRYIATVETAKHRTFQFLSAVTPASHPKWRCGWSWNLAKMPKAGWATKPHTICGRCMTG